MTTWLSIVGVDILSLFSINSRVWAICNNKRENLQNCNTNGVPMSYYLQLNLAVFKLETIRKEGKRRQMVQNSLEIRMFQLE